MNTIANPRPAWDQVDYEAAVENLEREIQGLAVALRERGVSFPERPAQGKENDVVARYESLMAHAAQCRVRLSMTKPASIAATPGKPAQAPGAHPVQPKSPAAPQKPRAMTLTEKCRAAKAGK